jgi:hypothetical protein
LITAISAASPPSGPKGILKGSKQKQIEEEKQKRLEEQQR